MKKESSVLSVITAILAIISASLGIFYSFGGSPKEVENIYGKTITLFGDGIYAYDSLMRVGATKGTDITIIIASILLILVVVVFKERKESIFLQCGLLALILYSSICLAVGVTFNRLFLLYVFQFSSSLFAFILSVAKLIKSNCYEEIIYEKHLKGTGFFMIIAGCSVLVWLTSIIPAIVTAQPIAIIDVYTTEPTFVIDLGIILPACIFSGFMILKKKPIGYKLAPILFTLLTGVGLCVICQTAVQMSLGIILSIGEVFGLLLSFVILGAISLFLNIKLLRFSKPVKDDY